MKSEKEKEAFRARLEDLIGGERPFVWASRIGLTPGVFNRMWNEGTPPKADSLILIENATGVSLTWLLTGKGPKMGFAGKEQRPEEIKVEPGGKGPMDVSEDLLEAINKILEEKLGDRKSELSAGKLMTLTMTLFRFYSHNFIESEEFRQDTLEKNIESLVKLALPES